MADPTDGRLPMPGKTAMADWADLSRRPEVGAPVAEAHENGTADDVADGHGDQILHHEGSPGQRRKVESRGTQPGPAAEKNTRRDEVHIGNAVLEADGHESHDGKEDREDLADRLARGQGHPHRQADHPIAADGPYKGLAGGKVHLGVGGLQGDQPQGAVARLPEPRRIEQERQ
ncbi:hypothetical protein DESC_480231 [Desulfosarcina cetonica]|nr:hypothetical protein DESC_480231 [Desulfosarcina cetonica]